jgi:hypothetical protein
MKATVRFRIFGHLMSAAIVKALPKTPIKIIKMVITPEKRLNPKEDLHTRQFKIKIRSLIIQRDIQIVLAQWKQFRMTNSLYGTEKGGNLFTSTRNPTFVHEHVHQSRIQRVSIK